MGGMGAQLLRSTIVMAPFNYGENLKKYLVTCFFEENILQINYTKVAELFYKRKNTVAPVLLTFNLKAFNLLWFPKEKQFSQNDMGYKKIILKVFPWGDNWNMPRKTVSSSWIYDLKDRDKKKFVYLFVL